MISVIIPAYNAEKWLRKCLDSVLNQTYSDLEIIIVDDGSKDSTPEICDVYARRDSRVKIIHQQNAGAIKARLNALKEARGEWVAFVDSDDWIEPDMYERMLSIADADTDIVWCDAQYVLSDNKEYFKIDVCEDNQENIRRLFTAKLPGWMCTKLIRKKLLVDKRIDMTEAQSMFEDVVWSLQLLLLNPVSKHIGLPLYNYNLTNQESLTAAQSPSETLLKACPNIALIEKILKRRNLYGQYRKEFSILAMRVKVAIANTLTIKEARRFLPKTHHGVSGFPMNGLIVKLAYWVYFNCGWLGERLYRLMKRK